MLVCHVSRYVSTRFPPPLSVALIHNPPLRTAVVVVVLAVPNPPPLPLSRHWKKRTRGGVDGGRVWRAGERNHKQAGTGRSWRTRGTHEQTTQTKRERETWNPSERHTTFSRIYTTHRTSLLLENHVTEGRPWVLRLTWRDLPFQLDLGDSHVTSVSTSENRDRTTSGTGE